MEQLVFAVAAGRFDERIVLPPGNGSGAATVEFSFRTEDRGGRGGSARGMEADRGLRDDAARLDRLPGGRWQPWTVV